MVASTHCSNDGYDHEWMVEVDQSIVYDGLVYIMLRPCGTSVALYDHMCQVRRFLLSIITYS